jgi:hypothetical protein
LLSDVLDSNGRFESDWEWSERFEMSDPSIIPNAIRQYLRDYVARARRIALFASFGRAIALVLLWMMLWAIIDRIAPLPRAARGMVLLWNLMMAIAILAQPLRVAFARRFDWHAAASQIERRDSRFAGRLEVAVSQLLLPQNLQASTQLVNKIVSEAEKLSTEKLAVRRLAMKPAVLWWVVSFSLALAIFLLLPNDWLDLRTLIRRQLMPLATINAVTTTRISVDPGDVDVPQGAGVTISARAVRLGSGPMTIRLSSDGQQPSIQPMQLDDSGQFRFTVGAIDRDWQYDITGGDARSALYTIRALRRPGVARLRVQYRYPAYMNLAATVMSDTDGTLEAPVGADATLEVTCTEHVARASITYAGRRIEAKPADNANVYQATLPVTQSAPFQISLLSDRKVAGSGPGGMEVRAIADQPPVVRWATARRDLRLDARDTFAVRCAIADDYGAVSGAMLVQINNQPPVSFPLAIKSPGRAWDELVSMNLAELKVAVGDVLQMKISASDAAGGRGTSETIRVIAAPQSVGFDQISCADELMESLRLVQNATTTLSEAARATPSIEAPGARMAQLARAADQTDQIAAHLFRAISHAGDPPLCDWISVQIDRATTAQHALRAALGRDEPMEFDDRSQSVSQALNAARQVEFSLASVAVGEQARWIARDLRNFQELSRQIDRLDAEHAAILRDALRSAARDVDRAIDAIGIDPDDDTLMRLIDEKVSQDDSEISASSGALDWTSLAGVDRTELSWRLIAAARAQGLRREANFTRARDLMLLGEALKATNRRLLSNATVESFLSQLQHRRALNEPARVSLQQLLPAPSDELRSYESAAGQSASVTKALDVNSLVDRIRAMPAIAAILGDADSSSPAAVNANAPAQSAASTGAEPAGFEEPIRIYFQMLKEKQR